jgi:hypothetical protein
MPDKEPTPFQKGYTPPKTPLRPDLPKSPPQSSPDKKSKL